MHIGSLLVHCVCRALNLSDQVKFDADWLEKCQMAIDDPEIELNPVNNIVDFVDVALEILIVEWCTRGCLEPISIVKEDFECGIIKDGDFAGIPFIRLKENYRGQKGGKFSLKDGKSNIFLVHLMLIVDVAVVNRCKRFTLDSTRMKLV